MTLLAITMESLKQYLFRTGITELDDPIALERAKAAYAKWYKAEKNHEYKTTRTRPQLTLRHEEEELLRKAAIHANKPFATFIREAAIAYVRGVYLSPDEAILDQFAEALARIGNNVNQIAHRCNIQRSVAEADIRHLQTLIAAIDEEFSALFRSPVNLENALRKAYPSNKALHDFLTRLLDANC